MAEIRGYIVIECHSADGAPAIDGWKWDVILPRLFKNATFSVSTKFKIFRMYGPDGKELSSRHTGVEFTKFTKPPL